MVRQYVKIVTSHADVGEGEYLAELKTTGLYPVLGLTSDGYFGITNQKTLLPLNRNMAFIGDSRTFQGTAISATEYSKLSQGYIGWAQFLTRHRFSFRMTDNFGISGENTAQIYSRLGAALASSDAATWVVLAGTNDWSSSFTALGSASGQIPGGTDSIVNLEAIYNAIVAAGRICIFVAEIPRGDSGFTAQRLTASNLLRHLCVRDYLLSLRIIPGVYVADAYPNLVLANSTTGDDISTSFKDGLHPNAQGAYYIGLALKPVIEAILPPIDILSQSNADQYDATLFPKGLLNTNPIFDGTTGTKNTNGSGNLGTGWSENATPGFTRVYSQLTTAGKAWQQVVLGGTATSTGLAIRQVITGSKLTIGDRVQAVGEFEWDADVTNINAISLVILDNNTIQAGDFRPTATTERVPAIAVSGIMTTPVYTLTSTTLQLQISLQIVAASSPTGTIRFRNVGLRKVP